MKGAVLLTGAAIGTAWALTLTPAQGIGIGVLAILACIGAVVIELAREAGR